MAAARRKFYAPSVQRVRRGMSPALKKARAQLQASRKRAASLARNAKGKSGDVKTAGIVVAGGAASGALDAYLPTIAGIDSRWILGAAAVGAGAFAIKGSWGSALLLAGSGILAAAASEGVSMMLVTEEG